MYLLASAKITVQCDGETAYAYVSDLENLAEWFPGVIRMRADDDLPCAQVGKVYRETVSIPFRGRRDIAVEVVACETPTRLVTEGRFPGLLPRMEIDISAPEPGLGEIRWRMYSRNDALLARLFLLPLAKKLMQKRATAGMQNLRRCLERLGD